jgi:hypothetical protein
MVLSVERRAHPEKLCSKFSIKRYMYMNKYQIFVSAIIVKAREIVASELF